MTLQEYNDIRNHIINEYEYAMYRKSQAKVRGLEWTDEDEADYQKWCASRKRVSDWQISIMEQALRPLNKKIFEEFVLKE